jgi:hypothetical protein
VEAPTFVTNLDEKLTFEHVEPLILVVMQVPRWAAPSVKCVFEDQEAATIVWDHLEGNGAYAQSPVLTKSVFTRRNPMCRGNAC